LAPWAAREQTALWLSEQPTSSAEPVAEGVTSGSRYAQSSAELVDRALREGFGRRVSLLVLVVAWVVFIAWLFATDSGVGRLETPDGLWWFLKKAGFITGFIFVPAAVLILVLTRPAERTTAV
jgi:hypothetical protein